MRAVVGGQRDLLARPALAIRQILRLEAVEELQHAGQALLVIDVLDRRVIARRIGRHVVSERHGDVDQLPRHGPSSGWSILFWSILRGPHRRRQATPTNASRAGGPDDFGKTGRWAGCLPKA